MSDTFSSDFGGFFTYSASPAPTILVNTGTIVTEPLDTALSATPPATPNGIEVGSTVGLPGGFIFTGDSAITAANPTVGPDVLIDSQIFGQTTAEQSLLDLLGISVNAGTIAADGPAGSTFTIDVAANGTIAGNFLNTGTLAVLAGNEMVLAAASGSAVSSTGTVSIAAGGTLAIDNAVLGGAVVNNGSILVVGDGSPGQTDTVEISGALSGAGTLAIGTNGILKLDATTTQSIAFPTVGAGMLILPGPGTYAMPLLGLSTGDTIELASGGAITGVSVSGSTITIATAAGNAVLTNVTFAPSVIAQFYRFLDAATGDEAIQVAPITDNWFGSSGALGTGTNWTAGLPSSAEVLNFGSGGGTLTGAADGLEASFGGTTGWTLTGVTLDLAGFPEPPFDQYALNFGSNVTLSGSTLVAAGTSSFGSNTQTASVTAEAGSAVTTGGDSIGYGTGQVASLILSGAGTTWTEAANTADAGNGYGTGYLNVGRSGTGFLSVTAGAALSTGFYAILGENAGSLGDATVSGGQWSIAGNFIDGDSGGGAGTITAGGTISFGGTFAAVGDQAGSSGRLVIGPGSVVRDTRTPLASDNFYSLNIGIRGASGSLGPSTGDVLVNGSGALLDLNGNAISLGNNGGQGSLIVSDGGTVLAGADDEYNIPSVGIGKLGQGDVVITGAGSALLVTGGMFDGRGGTGNLVIENSGSLNIAADHSGNNGGLGVGEGYWISPSATGGSGSATVTSGGSVHTQGGIGVGGYGVNGVLNISNGGSVEVGTSMEVGEGAIVGGTVEVGNGALNIGAGGTLQVDGTGLASGNAALGAGNYAGAVGQINLLGAGALLNVLGTNHISLGTYNGSPNSPSGTGSMTVSQGAVASAAEIRVGYTGQGELTVNAGTVAVGTTLSVGAGALVGTIQEAGFGVVNIGANGTINVAGTGLAAGAPAMTAGSYVGATGIISVSGSHALLNLNGHDLRLGTNSGTPSSSGAGSLTTTFGGLVQAGTIVVGDTGAGSFNADIGGASATALDVGAQASAQGNIVLTGGLTGVGINALTIGDRGLGRVAATAGANLVVYSTATIGNAAGSDGQLAVTGGAHFRTYYLIDGQSGTGALTVSGGATGEIINAATIGFGSAGGAGTGNLAIGANGTVTVDGTGLAAGAAAVSVGDYANATGIISVGGSHALLNAGTHDIRLGTNAGNPASSGAGFLTATLGGLVQAGTIYVGDTGTGVFSANIGGASASAMDVGAQATGQGSVLLTGAITGLGLNALTVGDKGYGKVTESNGANLVVHGNVVLGNATGATGQVSIATNAYFQANTLTVGGGGSGSFSVDSGAVLNALNAATIGATGVLTLQGGKAVAAQFINQGNIAGNGTVQGPLVNNGVVTASAGSLSITGAITGTGVLAMSGSSGLVVGAVGAGQEFAFGAPGATLQLGNLAATGASVIAGFGAGDQIRVVTGGSIGTSFNATNDALTITAGAASQTFQVTGSHTEADFASSVVGVDTVLAANQTINLGTGPHLLFLGGSSTGDTVVAPSLPAAGTSNFLDVTGFGGTDILDFRAALAGTTWDGSAGDVGNYLSVAMSGASAVISLSQTSSGTGVGLVKLENSGPMTLSQVLAHATI